jgi:hypothetical protein
MEFSPIKSESELLPGKFILKMGMFPRIPKPEVEVFTAHRAEWFPKMENVTMIEYIAESLPKSED